MLHRLRADLHLHTCLSPCGDLDMSPRGVVRAALNRGLDLIAICDHNSAENTAATVRAARRTGRRIRVLSGMEICTSEEVHLLALFETPDRALEMQALVYSRLPARTNRPEVFGDQIVANEDDEVEGFNDRLLIAAADLDLASAVRAVHELGGLAIASHVDREAYGLIRQLGFIPASLDLDAVEISKQSDPEVLLARHPGLAAYPRVRNSDAHYISDVGSAWTEFLVQNPSLAELALAFRERQGRRLLRVG
ncbi:MAG: PHP domain-containing protein [Proteobacteria bacterium]|nr:PHP domain-containing protein [Pseudomonadota bacterium]